MSSVVGQSSARVCPDSAQFGPNSTASGMSSPMLARNRMVSDRFQPQSARTRPLRFATSIWFGPTWPEIGLQPQDPCRDLTGPWPLGVQSRERVQMEREGGQGGRSARLLTPAFDRPPPSRYLTSIARHNVVMSGESGKCTRHSKT